MKKPDLLPPLYDVRLVAMSPAAFTLAGLERVNGAESEFVERYLPHVHGGTAVRILTTREKMTRLFPSVDAFCNQHRMQVGVREDPDLHGRWVFVDQRLAYQSDASFKDGAKNADAVIMEVFDVVEPVLAGFESRWSKATQRR